MNTYHNLSLLNEWDSGTITIQGKVIASGSLPNNGFWINITDQEHNTAKDRVQDYRPMKPTIIYEDENETKNSSKKEPNEIQCVFWGDIVKKYPKKQFRVGNCFDFINPQIRNMNRMYHKHLYQIIIREYTRIKSKKFLHEIKSNLLCVCNKKLDKKSNKIPKKMHQPSILNWLK